MSWAQSRHRSGPSLNPPPVCFTCNQPGHYVVDCPLRNQAASFPAAVPPPHQVQPQHYAQPVATPTGYPAPLYQQPPQYNAASFQQPYSQVQNTVNYAPPQAGGPYQQPTHPQPQPYSQYPAQTYAQTYPQHTPQPQHYSATPLTATPQAYGPPIHTQHQHPPAVFSPQPNGPYPDHSRPGPYQQAPSQWNSGSQGPFSVPHTPQQQFHGTPYSGQGVQPVFSTPHQYQPQQLPQPGFKEHQKKLKSKQRFPRNQKNDATGLRRSSQSNAIEIPCDANLVPTASTVRESLPPPTTISPEKEVRREQTPEKGVQSSPATLDDALETVTEDEDFKWNTLHIFQEVPAGKLAERLARPLSASIDEAPVVQQEPSDQGPGSRFVTERNQKEFMLSVRDIGRWIYVQDDPAYAEDAQEYPLIPLDNVALWWAKRQGLPEPQILTLKSRKRSRVETNWNDDGLDAEAATNTGEKDVRDNKRQKGDLISETGDSESEHPQETNTIVSSPAPNERARTPCVGVESGDAWAPEPGEVGAQSSPADPTEALLASLGVTGEPRPVPNASLPPYLPPHVPYTAKPRDVKPKVQGPSKQESFVATSPQISSKGTQSHAQTTTTEQAIAASSMPMLQSSLPSGPPFYHQQSPVDQYESHRGSNAGSAQIWPQSNGISNHSAVRDGQNANTAYHNGTVFHEHNQRNGNGSLATSRNHGSYDANAPPHHNGHGHGHSFNNSAKNYGQGQNSGAQFERSSYSQGPHQKTPYGGHDFHQQSQNALSNSQYFSGQAPAQQQQQRRSDPYQPSNQQYGPSVHQGGPQMYSQPSNGVYDKLPTTYSAQPESRVNNMTTNQQQQRFTLNQGQQPNGNQRHHQVQEAPSRQDSGYASGRGSYSNGQSGDAESTQVQPSQVREKLSVDTSVHTVNKVAVGPQTSSQDIRQSDSVSSDEELSPTSMEVLGLDVLNKLESREFKKQKREKRLKRPQPVVDEAYGRRW